MESAKGMAARSHGRRLYLPEDEEQELGGAGWLSFVQIVPHDRPFSEIPGAAGLFVQEQGGTEATCEKEIL